MARWPSPDDDPDDNEDSAYDGDELGDSDDAEEPTIPCPYCQREIHEESARCPYCERFISRVDAPPTRKPGWMILGVVLALYAVYRWICG